MADIKLYAPIGEWGVTAADIAAQLSAIPQNETINLYISSPGGDVFDGIAIYNEFKQRAAPVNVFVSGLAASAASIVAMSGANITMLKGSMLMVHRANAMTYGNVEDHLKMAETLEAIDAQINSIYAVKTSMDGAKIKELMDAETWIDGETAVQLGFANKCDEDEEEEAEDRVNNSWAKILNRYKNAPPQILKRFSGVTNETRKEKPKMEKQAAAIADIEAKCEGATPEFVLSQIKVGASLDEAIGAWKDTQIAALKAENEALKAKVGEQEATIKNLVKAPEGKGVETTIGATSDNAGDPIKEWNAAINSCIAERKINKQEAVKIMARENPDLRAAYLEAYNAIHTKN